MRRTQVYLTKDERDQLAALADATGKKQSELIRMAIDRFLADTDRKRRPAVLENAAGLWKDRDDLPDFRAIRAEWDRR